MLPGICFEPMEVVDILDINLSFPSLVFGIHRFYAWYSGHNEAFVSSQPR